MLEILDRISVYKSSEEFFSYFRQKKNTSIVVSFINAHACNIAYQDYNFKDALLSSDYLLRDGVGVEIAMKFNKLSCGSNLNGTDLIPDLLVRLIKDGYKVVLMGTSTKNCLLAKSNIESNSPGAVLTYVDGFRDNLYYLKTLGNVISVNRKTVVVLGMGMPKQEILSRMIVSEFDDENLVVINGGAIIDFLSGEIERAPAFIRKIRLEWFFRLCREPRRLFKRYVYGNFIFLLRVFF